jgi:hypothetical protein
MEFHSHTQWSTWLLLAALAVAEDMAVAAALAVTFLHPSQ